MRSWRKCIGSNVLDYSGQGRELGLKLDKIVRAGLCLGQQHADGVAPTIKISMVPTLLRILEGFQSHRLPNKGKKDILNSWVETGVMHLLRDAEQPTFYAKLLQRTWAEHKGGNFCGAQKDCQATISNHTRLYFIQLFYAT